MKYTQKQLEKAFNSVKNEKNWKMPIRKILSGKVDQALVNEAVIHFTGSVPEFIKQKSGETLVMADGYYLTIGA